MKKEILLGSLADISRLMSERGITPMPFHHVGKPPTREQAFGHVAWLCFGASGLVTTGKLDEAHILLGKAQGILFALGESVNDPFGVTPVLWQAPDRKIVDLNGWRER